MLWNVFFCAGNSNEPNFHADPSGILIPIYVELLTSYNDYYSNCENYGKVSSYTINYIPRANQISFLFKVGQGERTKLISCLYWLQVCLVFVDIPRTNNNDLIN